MRNGACEPLYSVGEEIAHVLTHGLGLVLSLGGLVILVVAVLQRLDHAAIFLLIAGTYTPFTLVSLRGGWGWLIFALVWGLAAMGIALEAAIPHRTRRLSVALYLAMGWLVLIAVEPLVHAVHPTGLLLLLLGGAAYTLGVVFYAWRRLPYHHAVWHVFVMAGSACHFSCVLGYVIPAAS
jgi:hemolysin III